MFRWLIDWITKLLTPAPPPEPDRATRVSVPGVVAHYWDGSAPAAHTLRDVSMTGAYLYTTERWYPGTIIRILLQEKTRNGAEGTGKTVSIPAQVVRQGADGVALDFLFSTPEDQEFLAQLIAAGQSPDLTPRPADAAERVDQAHPSLKV